MGLFYGNGGDLSAVSLGAPEQPSDQDPLEREPEPVIQRVVQEPAELDRRGGHVDVRRKDGDQEPGESAHAARNSAG